MRPHDVGEAREAREHCEARADLLRGAPRLFGALLGRVEVVQGILDHVRGRGADGGTGYGFATSYPSSPARLIPSAGPYFDQ